MKVYFIILAIILLTTYLILKIKFKCNVCGRIKKLRLQGQWTCKPCLERYLDGEILVGKRGDFQKRRVYAEVMWIKPDILQRFLEHNFALQYFEVKDDEMPLELPNHLYDKLKLFRRDYEGHN